MENKDKKVLVVIGPTAVGKTSVSVELAKMFDGEVISGDSMQVYKNLDIGTAKVTEEEMQGIPHHLIDILEVESTYSVNEFQMQVRTLIDDIHSRGRIPIIAGGTGLYIKAALYDYEFSDIGHDDSFSEKYHHMDNQTLYDYLVSVDRESAKILHPNNRRRVLRAIEIYETTGLSKSEWHSKQKQECIYDIYMIGLTGDRDKLYERINKRVDIMQKEGLEKEIEMLHQQNISKDLQSMQAIGYKEWFDYFDNKISKEDVYNQIKQHSRNYAKRQMTWFRNQFDVHWYDAFANDKNHLLEEIKNDLINNGYFSKIVVAGGCFWGVEAYYQKIKGILSTRVGYAQGEVENPIYKDVKAQVTGHSEVVEIIYHSGLISLEMILEHLFRMIDPTSLNKQGEDEGTSYRSGVYYLNDCEKVVIDNFILKQQDNYSDSIVVEVEKLKVFYDAEEYHQKYLDKNPSGYCHISFSLIQEHEKKC